MNDLHNKDFQDFTYSENTSPKETINRNILDMVKRDLDPSHKIVFIKLVSIQAFIGILTLLFCPQFNLSLTNNHELFHYFHHNFGERICMLICGSIFLGTGAVFAASILKAKELKKVKQSKLLYYTSSSILALSAFFLFGAEIYLNLAIFWLLGATVSGMVIFELSRFLRLKFTDFQA